jgi:imidazoleglycerol-phosphate dehydratase
LAESVLIRDCSGWPRLADCLRVTVGTPDENDAFLARSALQEVLVMSRSARQPHTAQTKETSIELSIDLDGTGHRTVRTGIPFYDHMLEQVGKHGGFDLRIDATGDLHIDTHHTVEDVGIALGEAFRDAVGDKAGVRRFASGRYPLDEALVDVALDLSGRPYVVWDVEMPECLPLGDPAVRPAARRARVSSFATAAGITLHVRWCAAATCTTSSRRRSRGSVGACATRCASRARRLPSTKGVL